MIAKISSQTQSTKLNKFKSALFNIIYLMLKKYNNHTAIKEISIISIEFIQLLSFSFHSKFALYWKLPLIFNQISYFLQFTHLIPFFSTNEKTFYFFFYICIVILIIFNSLIACILILFNKTKYHYDFILKVIKQLAFYLSTVLYIPLMQAFFFPLNCINSSSSIINCDGSLSIFNGILGSIFAILLSMDSIVIKFTLFEIKASTELNYNIGKSTGLFDFGLVIAKSILIIAFIIFDDYKLIMISCSIAIILYYLYNSIKPHYNKYITHCYYIWILIFSYSTFLALIGEILADSEYNGNISLFIIGSIVIIIGTSISIDNNLSCILVDINTLSQAKDVVRFIHNLQFIIKEIEAKKRKAKIEIQGYIQHYEEYCTDDNCLLKRYDSYKNMNTKSPNNDNDYIKRNKFLFHHIEQLYQFSLSKYRKCNMLRLSYAIFLIHYMKNSHQSMREFSTVESSMPTFEQEFIIFRYRKYIDEEFIHISHNAKDINENTSDAYNINNNDISITTSLVHNFNFILLKKDLKKISLLYIEFWSLLSSKTQDISDLGILSELGTKITYKIEKINKVFDSILKTNTKEPQVFFIISEYMDNILNKSDKADEYRKTYIKFLELKEEIIEDQTPNFEENTLLNLNDEHLYIILSVSDSLISSIINISLSLCALFGYTKNELIGQPIELLLPELYKIPHQEILNNSLIEYKQSLIQFSDTIISKHHFVHQKCFINTKSKYLTSVEFQTSFIFTERNDILMKAEFKKHKFKHKNQSECCVMTNTSLYIDSFTPNSITSLHLNSSQMKNGVDITKYIKQFYEEFLCLSLENDYSSPEDKLALKNVIIEKYFNKPKDITWKFFEGNNQENIGNKRKRNSIDSKNINPISSSSCKEIFCTVNVEKIIIHHQHIGYLFRFDNFTDRMLLKPVISSTKTRLKDLACTNINNSNSNFGVVLASPRKMSKDHSNNRKNFQKALDDNNFYINDGNYVPSLATSFQIDLKSRAYQINVKNTNKLRSEIMHLVDDKMQKMRITTIQPNESSSYDDNNDSYDSNDNDESKSNSDNSNQSEKGSLVNYKKGSIIFNDNFSNSPNNTDIYYKVNFHPIKYFQYNYKKSIVEPMTFEKKSQVELRKNNEKEDESKIHELNQSSSPNQNASNSFNDIKINLHNNNSINNTNIFDYHREQDTLLVLSKKVEYALAKEESQPTITRLKWVSFISFVLLLAYLMVWLTYFLLELSKLKLNFLNLSYAFNILINNACAFMKVKELTLLFDDRYVKYLHDNKTQDIQLLLEQIHDIGYLNSDLITNLITSQDFVTQETEMLSQTSNVTMSIIKPELWAKIDYKTDLLASLTQGNTELFLISAEVNEFLLRDRHIYFFIQNASNGMSIALKILIVAFHSRFELNIASTQNNAIIIFVNSIPLAIILSLIVIIAFTAVSQRKNNYLEVFFKIQTSTIKSLLAKCEKFNLQIQTESLTEFGPLSNNLCDSFDDKFLIGLSKEDRSIDKDMNNNMLDYPINNTNLQLQQLQRKAKDFEFINNSLENKKRMTKDMLITRIKILAVFVIEFGFFIALYTISRIYVNSLSNYVFLFLTKNYDYFSFITLFINYRELITLTDNYMGIDKEKEDFNYFMVNFYLKLQGFNKNSTIDLPAEYLPIYEQLFTQNLCDLPEFTIPEEINCSNLFYMTPQYGLDIFGMTLYNQVTLLKSINDYYNNLRKKNNFRYNLTVEGTEVGKEYLPAESMMELYISMHPIIELNTIQYYELNQAYTYFLEPGIKLIFNHLSNTISSIINSIEKIVISIIGAFAFINVFFYFVLWKPFEYNLNIILFKTKNLLSIIPSDVLGMMASARVLLGIDRINTKQKENKRK